MKLNQLIRAILNLLGIYTIFTAIVTSGMSVILIPITMIYQGIEKMEATGFSILMVLFQLFLPLTLGILLVWQSKRMTAWVLASSGIDIECDTERLELKEFPFIAFSLLGLYMLSQTIPSLCHFIAYVFQAKVQEASYMTTTDGRFLENHLQDIVYHTIAVGFSFWVFMKGKSFGKFALALKKRSQPSEMTND